MEKETPKSSSFSDFFLKWTPEERKKVILEVMREANEEQRKQLETPTEEIEIAREALELATYHQKAVEYILSSHDAELRRKIGGMKNTQTTIDGRTGFENCRDAVLALLDKENV